MRFALLSFYMQGNCDAASLQYSGKIYVIFSERLVLAVSLKKYVKYYKKWGRIPKKPNCSLYY